MGLQMLDCIEQGYNDSIEPARQKENIFLLPAYSPTIDSLDW